MLLPLIGPGATLLYHVLAWLIPKVERMDLEQALSLRDLERRSRMAKSTVQRHLQLLAALGVLKVIPRDPGQAPEYRLVNIRPITDLGKPELVRRLRGVQWWDTTPEGKAVKEAEQKALDKAKTASGSGDPMMDSVAANHASTEGPTGGGVQPLDTLAKDGQKVNQTDNLSHRRGDGVPEKGGCCPTEGGVVSHGWDTKGVPLINQYQEQVQEQDLKTPPTPEGEKKDGTVRELILPYEGRRFGEDGFVQCLDLATRWVLEGQGVTNPKAQPIVFGAMKLHCEASGATVEASAQRALAARREYLEAWEAGAIHGEHAYGIVKFYRDAHWLAPNTWPWNQAKRAEAAERLLAGARAAEREQKRLEDMKVALSFWLTLKDRGSVRYPRECPADLRELLENKLEWVRAFCGETS